MRVRAAFLSIALVLIFATGSTALARDLEKMSRTQLENEKLRQEISQLERGHGWWAYFQPLVPVLIAAGGLLLAVKQHVDERLVNGSLIPANLTRRSSSERPIASNGRMTVGAASTRALLMWSRASRRTAQL